MGPNQVYKLSLSKGNHKQKDSLQNGENICKWCDQQGLNFQNIQRVHTTQKQTLSKNRQETLIEISLKKTSDGQYAHEGAQNHC